MTTITTYIGAHGFFLAPREAVALTTERHGTITAAALAQRISPYYSTQEAAEAAAVAKQAEYDAVDYTELGPRARSHIEQNIERMRQDDREFISAQTVAEFDGCSEREAAAVLTGMGWTPEQIGEVRDISPGRINLPPDETGREFAVIGSRKWTKVPEYMSNGQLTARFFVDESTGEVRLADGWKSPKSWPLGSKDTEFVLAIVAKARQ